MSIPAATTCLDFCPSCILGLSNPGVILESSISRDIPSSSVFEDKGKERSCGCVDHKNIYTYKKYVCSKHM